MIFDKKKVGVHVRIISVVLCVILLCVLQRSSHGKAACQPMPPYDLSLMYQYEELTESQKELFFLIYAGIRNNVNEIKLPEGSAYDDVSAAADCIHEDCPELCNVTGRYSVNYYQNQPEIAISVCPEYCRTPDTVDELIGLCNDIADETSGDELSREKMIYDWLIGHCEYSQNFNGYSAYEAIAEGEAVCEGYARAFMLLLRQCGIKCGLISGTAYNSTTSGTHTWNIVRINGMTFYCDTTWDDPFNQTECQYYYFNVPMMPQHVPNGIDPETTKTLSMTWQAITGSLIREGLSPDDWISMIAGRINDEGKSNIRFESKKDYDAFKENFQYYVEKIFSRIRSVNNWSCIYSFNDEQYCCSIMIQ